MQFHEAKIIRTSKGVPAHMREEADRVVKLHAAMVAADRQGRYGIGRPPDGPLSHEFATLDPSLTLRINKVLVFNLLLACRTRDWLPVWGTNV